MSTRVRDSFKKGSVELVVLSLLIEKDLYGYEITQMILERGEGLYIVPEGSLYPTLYRLEDNGYVSSYKKLIGKRMTRVYYHIETKGIDYFLEIKEEYYAMNKCIRRILEFK